MKRFVIVAAATMILATFITPRTFAQDAPVAQLSFEEQRQKFFEFFGPREERARITKQFRAIFNTKIEAAALDIEVVEGSKMGKATFVPAGEVTITANPTGGANNCRLRAAGNDIAQGFAGFVSLKLAVGSPLTITGYCDTPGAEPISDSFFIQVYKPNGPGTIAVCEKGAQIKHVNEAVVVFVEHNLAPTSVIFAASGGVPSFDPAGTVGYERSFTFSSAGIKQINGGAMDSRGVVAATCEVMILSSPRLTAPARN